MDITFFTGIAGSILLVAGAAWPEAKNKHPVQSLKNWLLALGALVMLIYALLGYQQGGPFFFIILELLVVMASLLMMLNVPDKVDVPLIVISGIACIVWSLYLFEDYNTLFFILGLSGISLGYAFETRTVRRSAALTIGSALIALFSYLEASWIFFWLNVFFAIFSAYYLWRITAKHTNPAT